MHGNQWVLKIAVLKYYSVSKRGTTAKSNPKQATDPISLHTKFGDNSSNTFPLNERKPCVTPDIGRRTSDGAKSKNNISTPQGGGHNTEMLVFLKVVLQQYYNEQETRLGQLGANISPDRSSLTPQVLIGNFLKHNYPLLYELQHINLLCLYLPKEDGVSPDAEYIPQIIFSIFLQ